MASSGAKIIIGTKNPDNVIAKLDNGCWTKMDFENAGLFQFHTGIYEQNPTPFPLTIAHGKSYYIKCEMLSHGLKLMAKLKVMKRREANEEMKLLRKQSNPYGLKPISI